MRQGRPLADLPSSLSSQRVQQRIREVALEMLEVGRKKKIAAANALAAKAAAARKRPLHEFGSEADAPQPQVQVCCL